MNGSGALTGLAEESEAPWVLRWGRLSGRSHPRTPTGRGASAIRIPSPGRLLLPPCSRCLRPSLPLSRPPPVLCLPPRRHAPPALPLPWGPRGSPQKRRYEYLPAGRGTPASSRAWRGWRWFLSFSLSLSLPLRHSLSPSLSLSHTHPHTHARTHARSILPSGLLVLPRPPRLLLPANLSPKYPPGHVSSGSRTPLADPYPYSWDGAYGASPEPPAAGVTAPLPLAPIPPGPCPTHHGPEGCPRR